MSKNTNILRPNTTTLFKLSDFGKKPMEVKFINEQISHDGGLLLLNEVEKQLGLIEKLAGCISDPRHQGYVVHSIDSMLKQRVMQIAAGLIILDCDDTNALTYGQQELSLFKGVHGLVRRQIKHWFSYWDYWKCSTEQAFKDYCRKCQT